MANTRDIRRRIKSIASTKKITKAMEMVASAKMRRAVQKVLSSRPYANLSWQLILNVAGKTNINRHELLQKRTVIKKVGVVLVSSNRGFCGSFNQQVAKAALEYLRSEKEKNPGVSFEFISLGKKGARLMIKAGQQLAADFDKADVVEEVKSVRPLAKIAMTDFLAGKYDKVILIYTDFISSLRQVPRVKQLLPLEPALDVMLGAVGNNQPEAKSVQNFEYLFEPNAKQILDEMLPRMLEVQVYQSLLESNASEFSSRMLAMRNASDAAGDMIDELTLAYNQVRQAGITREIAEIAGGKAALE